MYMCVCVSWKVSWDRTCEERLTLTLHAKAKISQEREGPVAAQAVQTLLTSAGPATNLCSSIPAWTQTQLRGSLQGGGGEAHWLACTWNDRLTLLYFRLLESCWTQTSEFWVLQFPCGASLTCAFHLAFIT